MARKLGVPRDPGYKKGSHWANCYSCGFRFRAEDLQLTWDNRWVCSADYEPRHPQDFLRVKEERIGVDQPILPDDDSNEVDPTFLTATSTVPDPTFGGSGL